MANSRQYHQALFLLMISMVALLAFGCEKELIPPEEGQQIHSETNIFPIERERVKQLDEFTIQPLPQQTDLAERDIKKVDGVLVVGVIEISEDSTSSKLDR